MCPNLERTFISLSLLSVPSFLLDLQQTLPGIIKVSGVSGAGPGIGVFESPQQSKVGDSRIRILRIDPERFGLRLMTASAPELNRSMTAREWCAAADLVAAINASMYQTDYKTSVSLMLPRMHVNNSRLSKDKVFLRLTGSIHQSLAFKS